MIQRYFRTDQDAVDADGWFATGDVASIDADGYLRITDRSKDVIKSGGEWINSIDLENTAMAPPAGAPRRPHASAGHIRNGTSVRCSSWSRARAASTAPT